MQSKRLCPSCGKSISLASDNCSECGKKFNKLLIEKIEDIFKNRGYKTETDLTLSSSSGEEHKIDIYVGREFDLHKERIVLECEVKESPLDKQIVEKLDNILQDTKANKGIIISPSGFTNEAETFAKQKGIALIDEERLP